MTRNRGHQLIAPMTMQVTTLDKKHRRNARENHKPIFCMLRSIGCNSGFAKAEFLCNVVGERFL